MSEEIGFEDKGPIEVPTKGDIITENLIDKTKKKITREEIEKQVRAETGTEPEKPKTPIPADVPQLCFHAVAKLIDCPKFELDADEARTIAHHLTILIPIEGKMISVVVILMVVVNKVITCMDAIKRMFKPKEAETVEDKKEGPQNLPEQIK